MKKLAVPILFGTFLVGCNAGSGSSPSANITAKPIGLSFLWCSGTPEFMLSNVPKETKTLSFRMIDQQAQGFPHGGGEVVYSGQSKIECGALGGGRYQGPSPPPPQVHDYEWTVTALDASGGVIGIGRAARKFPE